MRHRAILGAMGLILLTASVGAKAAPGCASPETPATAPATGGPAAGTSPGAAGTSGFTGGLGGSYIGTTPSGPAPASPSAQPATARGLDPIGHPKSAPAASC